MIPASNLDTLALPHGSEDVQIVPGVHAILFLEPILVEFAVACGQEGAVADLAYFLHKPGFLKRSPVLLLFLRRPWIRIQHLCASDLAGAVLLYEYRLSGLPTRIYSSNDRSGRSTVLGHPSFRPVLAAHAGRFLLAQGAQALLLSFRAEDDSLGLLHRSVQQHAGAASWTCRERSVPDYLALYPTYDQTLAHIGQRTRSNLRYYRRRAEKDLGCRFVSSAVLSLEDLLAFNRQCMYPVPDRTVQWRYKALMELKDPILMGAQDSNANWLSIIGGRRFKSHSEILWQMNRNNLPAHSISLVARGYMIEHEIARGATRFYIEGGSPHPICQSFAPGQLNDLVLLRRSLPTAVLRKLARTLFEEENELAQTLFDPDLPWHNNRSGAKRISSAHLPSPGKLSRERGSTASL